MLAPAPGYVRPITVAVVLPVAYRPSITWSYSSRTCAYSLGDHAAARPDVGREQPSSRSTGALLERADGGVQADIRDQLPRSSRCTPDWPLPEVGVEALLAAKLIEALDRVLQLVSGKVDLACEIVDGFTPFDRAGLSISSSRRQAAGCV